MDEITETTETTETTIVKDKLNNIVNSNYYKYLAFAKNIKNRRDLPEDIVNECLLFIYETPIDKIERILPFFDFYLLKIIKYSTNSKTSKYQQKYNRIQFDKNVDVYNKLGDSIYDDNDIEEIKRITIESIPKILNKMDSYLSAVFRYYNEQNLSFKEIENKTGIPSSSFYIAYNKAKKILKLELKKSIN